MSGIKEKENFEETNLYHDGIVYHANIDENLSRLNMENLMYPGPIVPFIGYQSNNEDIYSKIPYSQGDNIPEMELSTLEANKMALKISINEKESERPIETHSIHHRKDKFEFLEGSLFNPIELYWENLYIKATMYEKKRRCPPCGSSIKKEKFIIKDCKGVAKPGTFTAILGPSGSGKTTLLNFLSSRMLSKNLTIYGKLKVNGVDVENIDVVGNQVAYVMQDDILLATFTPREAFTFAAALRLTISEKERIKKVETLISDLGLTDCANTIVGNTLLRGISGGERKRTSIGVELLTNPSLIFMDEPTTGLDSATAFNVLEIMKSLAKNGRTVISTIHQPSSEIFEMFDKLLLLVQGELIYQGDARYALTYFEKNGLPSPPFCNPATFFMKCMNPEGLLVENMQKTNNYAIEFTEEIKSNFKIRLENMVKNYKESSLYSDIAPMSNEGKQIQDHIIHNASWVRQFWKIMQRGFQNEIRNPMDLKMKIVSTVFMAIVNIIVFYGLGEYRAGIQNRIGVMFFFVMINSFGSIMGSLLLFSAEKSLFLRERLNHTYCTSAYFWGRTTSEFPFHVLVPFLNVCIAYWSIGLTGVDKFFLLAFILIIVYFSGVSYGLFLSVIFPKPEMAMALIPVIIVPFMLFAGFFSNQNNVPYYFYEFQYLSIFKYGLQAAVMNEFSDGLFECAAPTMTATGMKKNYCDPVAEQNYDQNITETLVTLFFIGLGIRIVAFIGLYILSNPKKPKISKAELLNGERKNENEEHEKI